MNTKTNKTPNRVPSLTPPPKDFTSPKKTMTERGGPSGPEPTRYGDWEKNGRVSDF